MNILLIMADQFAAHALEKSRSTDSHFKTPNLNKLAAVSTVFTQAYTPFPLCVPARSAMLTGKYPHQLGIMNNKKTGSAAGLGAASGAKLEPGHSRQSVGHWFTAAGYDCAYAGKWHALQASASESDGFAPIHPFGDEGLVEACHEWLGGRGGKDARGEERPFMLVASFDDPHSICEYARSQPMPYGGVPSLELMDAPPLPANFPPAPYAPEALEFEQQSGARMYGTLGFSPDDWRNYRGAYAALVERVDHRIGELLDGIDLASTAVIFVSDHGDGDASHSWNQKTALYQECIRVPLLVHVPGRPGKVEDAPVPALLGLLSTLCDVAGIDAPEGLSAGSVLTPSDSPVVVETSFADAAALPGAGTAGRALIKSHWKYTVYGWGKHREQLHDLLADPQEQRNLAVESAFLPVLEDMRAELLKWCEETRDASFLKRLVLPQAAPPGKHQEFFRVPY